MEAANVVGVLPGRRVAAPLLVGGHHDGWFAGAFDDATGVAAALSIARAFVETGVRPRRPIAFLSHTAEEYGIADSRFDWCYGAWYQIAVEHRGWASRAPFYLNVEGSGLPYPLRADPPPELAAWSRRLLRRAARDGLLPHGFFLASPDTLTEVWPFLAAGVPGINVSSFSGPWYRTSYHTQFDTSAWVDFDYLAGLTRVFSRFLLDADCAPEGILDFQARATHLRRALGGVPETAAKARVQRSLARLARIRTRAAFTSIARGLCGLGGLDPGADLWEELAGLRGEADARASGPWLERRLERELERARRELDRCLLRMAEAIEGKTVPLRRGGYPAQRDP